MKTARWVSGCLATYAVVGAVTTLVGWATDTPRLTDWADLGISMQPNAALAAGAAGAGLLLMVLGFRRFAAALGAIAALIGAATLFQHVTAISLGIDTLLFDRPWGVAATTSPGRMGPPASTCLTLVGLGLCLARTDRGRARGVVAGFGLATAIIALNAIIGYAYGASQLYDIARWTGISLQNATILLALGLGLVAAVPERQPARTLWADSAAGLLVRRALPFVVLLPLALGWLQLRAQEAGLVDTGMGTAVLVLALIVLLCVGLAWSGSAVAARESAIALLNERKLSADRALSEALRDADRRKSEFLALLAHEMRNPLAVLTNSLEVMGGTRGDTVTVSRVLPGMKRQVAQMVRLIDDLFDASRISSNRLALDTAPVDLGNLLRETVEASRGFLDGARQRLDLALPEQSVWVDGDAGRLSQVFGNLLGNASKYSAAGATIWLSLEVTGGEAVVRVRDAGAGIPAEMLDSVFDLFVQLDRPLARSRGGLGVGLTLVKQLVELHGGAVRAHSEGEGRGSELTVRLPVLVGARLAAPAAESAVELPVDSVAKAAPATAAVVRRVLVVDDNPDIAASLSTWLRLMGLETQVAGDGPEALQRAEADRPDAILLDLGLPGMDGYQVCREIRAQPWGAKILVIALTGWGREEDRRRSKEAGFDAHLVKPVDYSALMGLLSISSPRQAEAGSE